MASTGGTTTSAECPICHAVVQTATINSHIDRCLREENSSKFSPVIKKRQASLTPTSQAKIRKVDSQAQQDEHDRYVLFYANVLSIMPSSLPSLYVQG